MLMQWRRVARFCTSSSWRWATWTACTRRRCVSSSSCSTSPWRVPTGRRSRRGASRTSSSTWPIWRSRTRRAVSTRPTSSSSRSSWRFRSSWRRKPSIRKSFSASLKVNSHSVPLLADRIQFVTFLCGLGCGCLEQHPCFCPWFRRLRHF